ncbi:aminopeptidase [Dictyobacter aurantiacus]|uniref:Aminopeptidase n=1 Tax=Dictyobacter aurantiacus TaxID=1936993 RepID=A0A401ZDC0_9CHLR|nr:aminopeptidase [Dictyobacter aurantiacus]GCE04826.1 aminopeptidase [Dictyobacter aurantiacus]
MADPRLQKLAKVLVNYSLALQPGETFSLKGPAIAAPLIKEIYREAIRAGAHVTPSITLDGMEEIFFKESGEEQIQYISPVAEFQINHFDAQFTIIADENTRALSHIDPQKMAAHSAAQAGIAKRFMERSATNDLRWSLTLYPTQAHAMDAGMSLSEYEDFVFNAGLLDQDDPVAAWKKVQADQQHIVDYLDQHDEIHIVAPGTDLTYRVAGRKWINCAGDKNFPDGEVFTGPIENSVNGYVSFTYPAVYNGNEVENVRLVFKDGKVVESSAGRGKDFLDAMLNMDAGSRYLGEVAFGLNYNVQRFTKEILFDEKIGGTMHMALGAGYPETGSTNESGLHWDMVCDLHEGKVFADGELCYENGKFII